jgi:ankyrin repeat protein
VHYAAANTNPDILKFLLANGPDPNELDQWRRTPLMIAAELGRIGNIQVFLEEFEKRQKGSGSKSDQSESEEEENGSEDEYGSEKEAGDTDKINVDFVN